MWKNPYKLNFQYYTCIIKSDTNWEENDNIGYVGVSMCKYFLSMLFLKYI